jgi:ORF6N domain
LKRIARTIVRLRGQNVIRDVDLAALYEVTTKRLNEQVKRNRRRFPPDFMFQLTQAEYVNLRSHIATSSSTAHGGRRYLPHVFTEHGAIMAASVLNSPRAVQMSIFVVRAFVGFRRMFQSNAELATKLDKLEAKCDAKFEIVFEAIRELMMPPPMLRKRIGFRPHA